MTSPSWPTPPDHGRAATPGPPQRPAAFTPAWPPIGLPGSADPLGDDATIVLPRITVPIAEQAVALAEAAAARGGLYVRAERRFERPACRRTGPRRTRRTQRRP